MRRIFAIAALALSLSAGATQADVSDWVVTRTTSGCRVLRKHDDLIHVNRPATMEWSGQCDSNNLISGRGTLTVLFTDPPRPQRGTYTFTANAGLLDGAVQVSLHSLYPIGWRPDVYPEVRTDMYRSGCPVEDTSCEPADGPAARQAVIGR